MLNYGNRPRKIKRPNSKIKTRHKNTTKKAITYGSGVSSENASTTVSSKSGEREGASPSGGRSVLIY